MIKFKGLHETPWSYPAAITGGVFTGLLEIHSGHDNELERNGRTYLKIRKSHSGRMLP